MGKTGGSLKITSADFSKCSWMHVVMTQNSLGGYHKPCKVMSWFMEDCDLFLKSMTHDSIFYCVWYSLGKAVNEIIITTLLEPFVTIWIYTENRKQNNPGRYSKNIWTGFTLGQVMQKTGLFPFSHHTFRKYRRGKRDFKSTFSPFLKMIINEILSSFILFY